MKKSIQTLMIAFTLAGGSVVMAQEQNIVMPCATYEQMEAAFQNNPGARERFNEEQENLRKATAEYEKSLQNTKVGAAYQYTIPVVFHIIHNNGSENISDANCIAALASINKDFSRAGSDTGNIYPAFKSIYINSDIKFMLAHKDPSNNCTSGIVHHYSPGTTQWNQSAAMSNPGTYYAYTGTTAGKWNPTKYLNIYVVKSICPTSATCSTSGGVILGYTYKPGTWPSGDAHDAFVIVSSMVNSNYMDARTLSHEIGHWLNLSHTWGNTNNPGVACGNDGVADTPITKGFFSTCPSSATGSGCSSPENVENIMDYSSCVKMFTQGQTNVMRTALASGTSGRSNLWTTTNLTATDVNGTTVCTPIADFYAQSGAALNAYTVCSGGSLNFFDVSYNAAVTSRTWTATGGGTIANPNGSSTNITFPTVGTQTVTLTVSNSSGNNSLTKLITVVPGAANYATTYQESFETTGLPTNWSIINQTGGVTWQQYFGAAASGNNSYYMNNTINPNNAIDILETPSYDFLSNPGATFTFKYAYAQYSTSNADVFKVQASRDCGASWSDIYQPTNTILQSGSGGVTTTPFVPTPSQFKLYTLTSIPSFNIFKTQPNVRIRFYWMEDPNAGFGNNFYLDDINFNAPMGVNELTKSIGFNVFPNPTNGSANVVFTLSERAVVKYDVTDVTGRIIESMKATEMPSGSHSFDINANSTLKAGVYLVNFELNGQKMSRKLIVE